MITYKEIKLPPVKKYRHIKHMAQKRKPQKKGTAIFKWISLLLIHLPVIVDAITKLFL